MFGGFMVFRYLLVLILVVVFCVAAPAEEPNTNAADNPIKFPTQTAELVVSVTDEDGKPIQGVVIKPYGCRSVEEPSTGWFWPIYNIGHPTEHVSDAKGKVVVDYPITFGHEPDWNTCSEITAMVTHPEFISQKLSVDPRNGKTTLSMKAGCQLTISANGPSGENVPFGMRVAGPGRSAKWLIDGQGVHKSSAIPDGSWQAMLVSPSADGRHLFSSVLPLRLRNQQAVSIRNLRLKPGLHLKGRLDDSVDRPVKNGKLIAHCLPKPASYIYGDGTNGTPSVSWETSAEINEDGTFEFLSLPRSGLLQLITICDGYVGKDIDVIEPNPTFRQGVFLQVADIDPAEELIVEMEPTGTVQVTVLDDTGEPLADAHVGTSPNQSMHLSGSNILGESWESITSIHAQLDPLFKIVPRDYSESRYSTRTNAKGIATITNLPLERTHAFGAAHEDYVMQSLNGRRGRETLVAIDADTPDKQITIKLVSIESAKAVERARDLGNAVEKGLGGAADLLKGLLK
jgi:hypothetical protein